MIPRFERLASLDFFRRAGRHGDLVFAEMPTANGQYFGLVVNVAQRRLYCTCPFFPKPCYHAQALLALLDTSGNTAFETCETLPTWAAALSEGLPVTPIRTSDPEATLRAREQRRFELLERAAAGFEELETWLTDVARRGLATVVSEDPEWHVTIAARLADASLRGISRNLRLLGARPLAGPGWEIELLEKIADSYLALRAFRQRDKLPENLLYDLQAYIGINLKKQTVLESGEKLEDVWAVLGQTEDIVEESLKARRTWLFGGHSGRFGLLLEYEFGMQGFLPGYVPGSVVKGTVVYYPGAVPLRMLPVNELETLARKVEKMPGYPDFEALFHAFAAAIGQQPWLEVLPAGFPKVNIHQNNSAFFAVDEKNQAVPLNIGNKSGWQLLALSHGNPLGIFGEWNGRSLRILSAVAQGRLVKF